jgi:3'(2'), 5'-bisphosphate nucleotidase
VTDDEELADRLATQAGELLLGLREQLADGEPDTLRAAGDRRSHDFLVAALADVRPGDVVLSEEGADPPGRLDARRVWIVDPLDGTREYGEPGRCDWAVHVALWQTGRLAAGAVALPALDTTYATGGTLPGTSPAALLAPRTGDRPRLVISRTRAPAYVGALAERLDAELAPTGSAGAKAMAVARGEADGYVHAGAMHEWDTAAPVAVARAAGLHTSRADGSPLAFNTEAALTPDLLICRPNLATGLLEGLAAVRA